MKRLLLAMLSVLLFVSTATFAADAPSVNLPIVMVFACPLDGKAGATDPDILEAATGLMRGMSRVDSLGFSPKLPDVARAVLEGRISRDKVENVASPQDAAEIAGVLKVDYILCVQGSASGNSVSVSLEMRRCAGDGRWVASSGSSIPEVVGANAAANRINAIVTATSTAVSQIIIQALGQDALVSPLAKGNEQPARVPSAGKTHNIDAEFDGFLKQADDYIAAKDMPNAVMALRWAINLKPDKLGPRIKLAEVYSHMGLVQRALDECGRALIFNPNDLPVHNMLARLYLANGAVSRAADECRIILKIDPKNSDALVNMGDIQWNQRKPDDALKLYLEASAHAPENPHPHERLEKYYFAKKQYGPALRHAFLARQLSAGKGLSTAAQYKVLARMIQDEFAIVLGRLDAADADYRKKIINRGDYYSECKDADARIDALADMISAESGPAYFKEIHWHGVLAVSLLSQATGNMLAYFETDKIERRDEADLLITEAKSEMGLYTKAVKKL
ncbi:MAG: tetratricopeptide repeat protein [Armatimonadota bacterium]